MEPQQWVSALVQRHATDNRPVKRNIIFIIIIIIIIIIITQKLKTTAEDLS